MDYDYNGKAIDLFSGPGYTEDVGVAGSLLYDKFENFYEIFTGPRRTFDDYDLHVIPDLKIKVLQLIVLGSQLP